LVVANLDNETLLVFSLTIIVTGDDLLEDDNGSDSKAGDAAASDSMADFLGGGGDEAASGDAGDEKSDEPVEEAAAAKPFEPSQFVPESDALMYVYRPFSFRRLLRFASHRPTVATHCQPQPRLSLSLLSFSSTTTKHYNYFHSILYFYLQRDSLYFNDN
jgi:hypothetical protein